MMPRLTEITPSRTYKTPENAVKVLTAYENPTKYFQTEDEKVYFFEPLEKEILVDDLQKIVDANKKLVKELKGADR